MSLDAQPLALSFASPSQYFQYVLRLQTRAVVVVCSSRAELIREFTIDNPGYLEPSSINARHTDDEYRAIQNFLHPTIQLVANLRNVKLVYAPSLAHLRAFLSTFQLMCEGRMQLSSQSCPVLALVTSLSLHRPTGDLSAQGISRTLALAVETAKHESMQLNIVEFVTTKSIGYRTPDGEETSTYWEPWEEVIPLLNGSIRHRPNERTFAGRTVKVGRVIDRWCKIVNGEDVPLR